MKIDIITLFPEMFRGPLSESLMQKAQTRGLFALELTDLRDFTTDKHKTADDSPYGGGPGMVLKPEPIFKALQKLRTEKSRVILMCPTGKVLTQKRVKALAQEEHLVFLCGHYEGVDERVRSQVDEEISIGDYVLTGGELPAMVLVDAVVRQLPGVVKESGSVANDSFYDGLLDHPSYTKPEEFAGGKVPPTLLSGHHKEIERWRRKEALRLTWERRPELLSSAALSTEDKKLLAEILKGG